MLVNVVGKLKTLVKLILLLAVMPALNACTPANPVFGFDFSSEKLDSNLAIKMDVEALNLSNAAKVIISGSCNEKAKIKLISPVNKDLECSSNRYQQSLDLAALPDGEVLFQIESKDVFGDILVVEKKIYKDMIAPTLALTQPSDIGSGVTSVNLNGTCSEEGVDVVVNESSTGKEQKVKCQSQQWSMSFDLGSDLGINQFFFKAIQTDMGLNEVAVNSSAVNRVVIGDFSISGVSHQSGGPFTTLLKGYFNNFYITWTPAVNVTSFAISIYEFNPGTSEYDIQKCNVGGISGSQYLKLMSGCALTAGKNYKVKMTAQNSVGQVVNREMNFATKSLPRWRLDAKKLYIGSSFETALNTEIAFSDLIEDYDSAVAPYSVVVSSIDATLSSIHTIDNANQKIIIAPAATKTSGKFSASFTISDSFGNTSGTEAMSYHLVMPFSWAGLVDNDFNKPGNWCGTFTLKSGCQGSGTAPSFNAKVMIDNLCSSPTANSVTSNCAPVLSAASQVHSFFIKANSFDQAGFSLTVGNAAGPTSGDFNRNLAFFKQAGGVFNSASASSSGDLFVLNYFTQNDGYFYAPYASNFTVSSQHTNVGNNVISIASAIKFFHNNSQMIFIDPQGIAGDIYIQAPANTEFYKVKLDTDGATWSVRSDNLIIKSDLELAGRLRAAEYPKFNRYSGTNKITLQGNLICSGQTIGGSVPIYIDANVTATYKTTHSDCKFPSLVLANTNSIISEDAGSLFDHKMESLKIISSNAFYAPQAPRKLIIAPVHVDTGSYAFYNVAAFNHNNGEIEFHNLGDGTKEYKVLNSSGSFNILKFINNSATGDFFNIQSNIYSKGLIFSGSHSVSLRGVLYAVTTDELVFNKGLTADVNVLSKIVLSPLGVSPISVNTSERINLASLELQRNISFSGSSSVFDLSGGNLNVSYYDFTVPAGFSFFYNVLNTFSGSIISNGTTTASSL